MSHPDQSEIDLFLETSLAIADLIDGGLLTTPDGVDAGLEAVANFNSTFDIHPIIGTDSSDFITVDSGRGFNFAFGGNGSDIIAGKRGNDALAGSDGADILFGRGGDDFLGGGNGADILRGGRGDDVLSGGNGGDDLRGGAGKDLLLGGKGADVLRGGRDSDILEGGNGADILRGGKGMDTLEGGAGDDILIGGKDADAYLFDPSKNIGDDLIRGFTIGEDVVVLKAQDVIDATPEIQALHIDAETLLTLDAKTIDGALTGAAGWNIASAPGGDLVVEHPGGTIEFDGISSDGITFEALIELGAVELA
ncbi:MAG: calcium-binding protein [Pseudomonadota bacterium]